MNTSNCIDLTNSDFEGFAKMCHGGWAFHGRFASHTGYRHYCISVNTIDAVKGIARNFFSQQKNYCYLVGQDHSEHGWKTIGVNYHKKIQVRLPAWASDCIKDTLNKCGLEESCSLNNFWEFPDQTDLSDARESIRPLLVKRTRFSNDDKLSEQLYQHYLTSPLGITTTQLDLFNP